MRMITLRYCGSIVVLRSTSGRPTALIRSAAETRITWSSHGQFRSATSVVPSNSFSSSFSTILDRKSQQKQLQLYTRSSSSNSATSITVTGSRSNSTSSTVVIVVRDNNENKEEISVDEDADCLVATRKQNTKENYENHCTSTLSRMEDDHVDRHLVMKRQSTGVAADEEEPEVTQDVVVGTSSSSVIIPSASFIHAITKNINTKPRNTTTTNKAKTIRQQQQYSNKQVQQDESQQRTRRIERELVRPYPQSPRRTVPSHIWKPSYAHTGRLTGYNNVDILIHNKESIHKMKQAAQLARAVLDYACQYVTDRVRNASSSSTRSSSTTTTSASQTVKNDKVSQQQDGSSTTTTTTIFPLFTTDDIDIAVHEKIISLGAYPSPLNYMGYPKSVCTSINEVICHGIPDTRPIQLGDVLSIDVSCFFHGVHGDNCATIIVGDDNNSNHNNIHTKDPIIMGPLGQDWRTIPYRIRFDTQHHLDHFQQARELIEVTYECLYAGIEQCKPGGCLSKVGTAIETIASQYGYSSIRKYHGHGIGTEFHCPPYVKHYTNQESIPLVPGMIFTIEPMITQGPSYDCYEWDDEWTVVTMNGTLAAQFEHMVLITPTGVEILTQPSA